MHDMNHYGLWAQGNKFYEKLRVMRDDMND